MNTFLLTWKPTNWHWKDHDRCVERSSSGKAVKRSWSSGNRRSISRGDRVFLLRQGQDRPGLVGSGYVNTPSYQAEHWDQTRTLQRKRAWYVDVDWDSLQPLENRLSREALLAEDLLPAKYVNAQAGEGEPIEHTGYRRLRDRRLREEAMASASGVCAVCEVDYRSVLGGRGIKVLQVHYTKQLGYRDMPRLTKREDLVVVCANCHLLIHLNRKRALGVNTLKLMIGCRDGP